MWNKKEKKVIEENEAETIEDNDDNLGSFCPEIIGYVDERGVVIVSREEYDNWD